MSLQRQRLFGRDDLEQKGESRTERLNGSPTHYAYGVISDNFVQGFAVHDGGGERMRAEPQFGLWFTRGFGAKQVRNGGPRTPGVRLNHPRQPLHHDSSRCGLGSPTTDCQRASVRDTASESRHGTIGDSTSPARRQRMTSWAWKV